MHDQLMARTRSRTSTEYLRINRPGDSFKRLFRQPRGDPCVCACVRPPTTRCSISTNDSDSSKTEHCLNLKDGRKLQRTWYCAVTSKRVASGGFRRCRANRKSIQHILSQRYVCKRSQNVLRMFFRTFLGHLCCMGSFEMRFRQGAKRCMILHDLVSQTLEPF